MFKIIYSTLFTLLLFTLNAQAQNTIYGTIIGNNDNLPMIGATVILDGTAKGAKTNIDGKFTISDIPDGTYTITINYVSYTSKKLDGIVLKAGEKREINTGLDFAKKEINEVVIRSTVSRENTSGLLTLQRKSNSLTSGISADVIKKSPDRNVGDVLKRASGMSVVGGKYAVVRGMEGRYVSTMINGILIPSTEPDKKAFSFDLIPANLIDNVTITKSALPENTGEFAGGIIDVNMKDIVPDNFLNISIGTGYNSQALKGKFATYEGGKTDFLGKDDGTRALPIDFPTSDQLVAYKNNDPRLGDLTNSLKNIWSYQTKGSPAPNMNFQITTGGSHKLLGNELGIIASASYNNSFSVRNQIARFTETSGNLLNDFKDEEYAQSSLIGGLLNLTYRLGDNTKIYFKNLYNNNAIDRVTLRNGYNADADAFIQAHELFFVQNSLLNSQLGAQHYLPSLGLKLNWNANYSRIDQSTPDRRILEYHKSATAAESDPYLVYIPFSANPQYAGRFYSNLGENVYSGKLDFSKDLNIKGLKQTIKVGGYYQSRDRSFSARNLGMKVANYAQFDNSIKNQSPESIFSSTNIGTKGFVISDVTNASDRYLADASLKAAYVQLDNNFSEKLKISWGVRVEDFKQNLYSKNYQQDTVIINNGNTDLLPSAVITYSVNNKNNIRMSASQTVVRPEFRELAPFGFYDFSNNVILEGNPNIKRNKVTNLDMRYEYYPRNGEMITMGVFYKQFKNAIQVYPQRLGGTLISYVNGNAPSAYNAGFEFELRKRLDFIAKNAPANTVFANTTFFSNLTLIKSQVKISDSGIYAGQTLPLINQSPTLINAGLTYQHPKLGTGMSILFYRYGTRLNLVGQEDDYISAWEAPRSILDIQFSQKMGKKGEVRLTIGDLLNQNNVIYQDVNKDKKFNESDDYIVFKRKLGVNYSLKYSYNF